ncbi:carotenoid ester lipase precursor [Obba rivulosa]|uniref:Carboxylic ester hydrolase n=1 Tax=Obba rivulosa TaxID=1052685 RepID=A0A8E2DKI0_9APHY|nr:carotenoid ester lipase precursor [Obba rivulosa]
MYSSILPSVFLILALSSLSSSKDVAPTVRLDDGTFIGATDGVTDSFLGIPFVKPPIGPLRFEVPQQHTQYDGIYNATTFGFSCPGLGTGMPNVTNELQDLLDSVQERQTPIDEDCLTLNVVAPRGTSSGAKLPVAVWIYGGGFFFGGSSMYDGSKIVQRSIELGEPVVYVSMNYRLSAYGFLASQEIKDAGATNLGLRDQREALKWVQRYVHAFGGDPTKVTIWGESSGALSVCFQMVSNGGNPEGLFRGAFIESGAPLPLGNYTQGQASYNALVDASNCATASSTLECLRELPFETLSDAIKTTPSLVGLTPLVDFDFITESPANATAQGKIANIPFVNGNCDDEGTEFTFQLNVTTEEEIFLILEIGLLPGAPTSSVEEVLSLYPADPAAGSPFDTGDANAITPQYKRVAAILGDLNFQGPRRSMMQQLSGRQSTWSFLSKRFKSLPIIGSGHETDIVIVYGPGDLTDYVINFVNHLDPNNKTGIHWPQYTIEEPQLLTLWDGPEPRNITNDTYRAEGISLLAHLGQEYPVAI